MALVRHSQAHDYRWVRFELQMMDRWQLGRWLV
jgi:hypothetical protein